MRKLLLTLVLAISTMAAWAGTREIKASPATGSVVTSIERFTLQSQDSDYPWIEVVDKESITVTRDDAGTVDVGQIKVNNYSDPVSVTLSNPITEPGTYVFTFPRGSVSMGDMDWYETVDAPAFTVVYIIEGQGGGDEPVTPPTDCKITANPADGSTLTAPFSSVTISSADPAYPYIDILSADDIQVMFNGEPFCGIKQSGDDNSRTLKFTQTPSESGVYTVVLPADSWEILTYDPEYASITSSVTLTYTLDLPGVKYDVEVLPGKVNPNSADGTPISLTTYDGALKQIFFDVVGESFYVNTLGEHSATLTCTRNAYAVTVPLRADAPKKKFSWDTELTTRFYIDLDPSVTQNGTYTLNIPKGAFGTEAYVADNALGRANKAFTTELVFVDGVEESQPSVKYDLEILGTKPAQGEVSNEYTWEVTTIYVGADYRPREGAQATLTCETAGYNQTGEVRFGYASKYNGTPCNILLFTNGKDPVKNGTYTLTIPQGTFGDAAWLANPDGGHSNPEITVSYSIRDREGALSVVYDILPTSTKPAQDAEVSIANSPLSISIMADGILGFMSGATMTLTSEDANYSGTVSFSEAFTSEYVTTLGATLAVPVTVNGTYTLTIPQGIYGDSAFLADCTTGRANAEYTVTFRVVGGQNPPEPTQFDLTPEVTPADASSVGLGDLNRITFVFPAGTVMNVASARATMQCATANYYDTALFVAAETDGTFTLNYGTKPTKPGVYTLKLKQGTFASADGAHQNPEITYTWTLDTSSVAAIATDSAEGYYDLTGRYCGTDRTALPAGIYISNGKKIRK